MSTNNDGEDAQIPEDLPEKLADSAEAVAESVGVELSAQTEHQLSDLDLEAEALDELAESTDEWLREERDGTVTWIDTQSGAVVYESVETQQDGDGFDVDVYRVTQPEGEDYPAEPGDLLGVAVDMPKSGVYVDWNIDAWPDDEQLSGPHVSEYDSLEDVRQVSDGELELLESDPLEQQAVGRDALLVSGLSQEGREYLERAYSADVIDFQQSVPDDAVSISDRDEAPEDAQVITGPRGGLYYIPSDGEGDSDSDSNESGLSMPTTASEASELNQRVESGEIIDPDEFWSGGDASPDIFSDNVSLSELEEGDIIKSEGFVSSDETYIGEVAGIDLDSDPQTITLETEDGDLVEVDGRNRNQYKPDEDELSEATTPSQLFDETIESMSDTKVSRSVGYIVQDASPSNDTVEQYSALLDSLSQDELQSAVVEWTTQSYVSIRSRQNTLQDLSEQDLSEPDDEVPSQVDVSSSKLGTLFSRMDEDALTESVDESYSELIEQGEEDLAEQVVTSAAAYGQSAQGRREVYEQYSDEIEFDEYTEPAVEMQFTDDFDEFRETALTGWVESETSAVSHHLTLATQSLGPNSEENTEAYTTDTEPFGDGSAGVPHEPIEPTEELESHVEQLSEEATEYYTENDPPENLYRGVSTETTTHGTLESWTRDKTTAKTFDGHSVLEADVNPEDILVSEDMLGEDWPDTENVDKSEQEYILFGGAFSED